MMVKFLGWIIVLVVSAVLVRALITGTIEYGTGPSGLTASRTKDPAGYWTIFLIGLCIIILFVWLLIP